MGLLPFATRWDIARPAAYTPVVSAPTLSEVVQNALIDGLGDLPTAASEVHTAHTETAGQGIIIDKLHQELSLREGWT